MSLTIGHIFYVPATMAIGFVIGWLLGNRAARLASSMPPERKDPRAARREERALRTADRKNENRNA